MAPVEWPDPIMVQLFDFGKEYGILAVMGLIVLALIVGAICGALETPRKHW